MSERVIDKTVEKTVNAAMQEILEVVGSDWVTDDPAIRPMTQYTLEDFLR